jgi:hypothetical protein
VLVFNQLVHHIDASRLLFQKNSSQRIADFPLPDLLVDRFSAENFSPALIALRANKDLRPTGLFLASLVVSRLMPSHRAITIFLMDRNLGGHQQS